MEINESLYSRQLYVLGYDAMTKMLKSNVLVIGLSSVGEEICKNLLLAGIRRITLFDPTPTTTLDTHTHYYLKQEHLGVARAKAILPSLQALNQHVDVSVVDSLAINSSYTCVVVCDEHFYRQVQVNDECRKNKICFVAAQTRGVFSQVFCDFDEFIVFDKTGEPMKIGMIDTIGSDGIVNLVEKARHDLEDGDVVRISENGLFDGVFVVEVIDSFRFRIGKKEFDGIRSSDNSDFCQGGFYEQQRKSTKFTFKPLGECISNPTLLNIDGVDSILQHNLFVSLSTFVNLNGNLPRINNEDDALSFLKIFHTVDKENDKIALCFARQCAATVPPVVSVVGGFVAQEVLKACSNMFTPLNQFLYFDCRELLDETRNSDSVEIGSDEAKFGDLIKIFGRTNMHKVFNSNSFLIGCGAIGCEHLKNLGMVGFGHKGTVHCTDMDSIEHSNLSRQFLFRESHISQMKSKVAAEQAMLLTGMNAVAYSLRAANESEQVFSDEFYKKMHFVANALDNIEARFYVDSRCVFNDLALFDSGTLGTKGNVQVVLPGKTESYASSSDPPEKGIPLCTIRNFPHLIEHCIEWAVDKFNNLFTVVNQKNDTNEVAEQSDLNNKSKEIKLKNIKKVNESGNYPGNKKECVYKAICLFNFYFNKNIGDLLELFPADHVTEDGMKFWTSPKRIPEFIELDLNNSMHVLFVLSCSNIYASMINIESNIDTDFLIGLVGGTVKKDELKKESDYDKKEIGAILGSGDDKMNNLDIHEIKMEKDDDSNCHINFIYAATNIRADNYRIKNASRHTVKGIAGRIIPAIATTTSVISGLCVIEIMKYVFGKKLDDFKNSYVSLALPYIATSTPLEPMKQEYCFGGGEKKQFTIWDKIKIKDDKIVNLLKLFKEWGTKAQLVLVAGKIIYMDGDRKYTKNLEKRICDFVKNKKWVEVEVVFDEECESFPTIVVEIN